MALLILLLRVMETWGCSAYFLPNGTLGKNYDWYVKHGHAAVFVNPRRVFRTAMDLSPPEGGKPKEWTSRYGSVTFTQFGNGFPLSGMNEPGLSVEVLQLDDAEFPLPRWEEPYLNEAQFIQFILDTAANVDEAIALLPSIWMVQALSGVHYLIADPSGASAAIEFIGGRTLVHRGAQVLTNGPYKDDMQGKNNSFSRFTDWLPGPNSSRRFARLQAAAAEKRSVPDSLHEVRIDHGATDAVFFRTQWTLIHHLQDRVIDFSNRGGSRLSVNLREFDFEKLRGTQVYDIDAHPRNQPPIDVSSSMMPYHPAFNEALVQKNRWLLLLAGKRHLMKQVSDLGNQQSTAGGR